MPFIEHLIRVTLCANESKSLIDVFFFLKSIQQSYYQRESLSQIIYCLGIQSHSLMWNRNPGSLEKAWKDPAGFS